MSKIIITKYPGYCILCGRPTNVTHHLCEGTGKRQLSDKYNLVCPVCDLHHNMGKNSFHLNPEMEKLGHIIGQLLFEKTYYKGEGEDDPAREEFRKIFGKSYL